MPPPIAIAAGGGPAAKVASDMMKRLGRALFESRANAQTGRQLLEVADPLRRATSGTLELFGIGTPTFVRIQRAGGTREDIIRNMAAAEALDDVWLQGSRLLRELIPEGPLRDRARDLLGIIHSIIHSSAVAMGNARAAQEAVNIPGLGFHIRGLERVATTARKSAEDAMEQAERTLGELVAAVDQPGGVRLTQLEEGIRALDGVDDKLRFLELARMADEIKRIVETVGRQERMELERLARAAARQRAEVPPPAAEVPTRPAAVQPGSILLSRLRAMFGRRAEAGAAPVER